MFIDKLTDKSQYFTLKYGDTNFVILLSTSLGCLLGAQSSYGYP